MAEPKPVPNVVQLAREAAERASAVRAAAKLAAQQAYAESPTPAPERSA